MKNYILLAMLCIFLPGCQSGCFSRFGGENAKLEVPKDCQKVISLGRSDNSKYISYLSNDGKIKMKEYSDFEILQADYEIVGATFDSNLVRK